MSFFGSITKWAGLAALPALLSGCGHVPVSTMVKLRSFDPLTVDVAALRIAMRAPGWLEPVPGGASIELVAKEKGNTEPLLKERFSLEPAGEGGELDQLKEYERKGERIWAFRLGKKEAERLRAIQAQARAIRAAGQGPMPRREVILSSDIKGCRRTAGESGPVIATTYLKPDAETGYVVLLRDLDLRKVAKDAGVDFDADTPPCGKIM